MKIAFPHPPGSGGPGSFQTRFEEQAKKLGWSVLYNDDGTIPDVILVVGGTKRLIWLWKMKREGVPILYRLDGINWLHRKRKTSLKHFLIAEYRNLNNRFIHAFLADHIIYQSQFVKDWWDKTSWRAARIFSIIHNGVDLGQFNMKLNPELPISLICLEGTLDYSPYAVDLLNQLRGSLSGDLDIIIYGSFEDKRNHERLNPEIIYKGKVARKEVPNVFKNAIYLSLDVNAACPNTVIEAMACGIPVVGFDSGSLKELVPISAGIIVPYGGNPWSLEYPDVGALAEAILKVGSDWDYYSFGARAIAVERYGADLMMAKYLDIINGLLKTNDDENR